VKWDTPCGLSEVSVSVDVLRRNLPNLQGCAGNTGYGGVHLSREKTWTRRWGGMAHGAKTTSTTLAGTHGHIPSLACRQVRKTSVGTRAEQRIESLFHVRAAKLCAGGSFSRSGNRMRDMKRTALGIQISKEPVFFLVTRTLDLRNFPGS